MSKTEAMTVISRRIEFLKQQLATDGSYNRSLYRLAEVSALEQALIALSLVHPKLIRAQRRTYDPTGERAAGTVARVMRSLSQPSVAQ